MAGNEIEQLSSKLFNILKDTDQTKNANIQASYDNLANSIININKELNSETATTYLTEIEKVNHPALQMQGLRLRHQCLSYS